MVYMLAQLVFVHLGMCTYLYDSGTWGLRSVYIVIFWKLKKKKEINLNILFLFSFNMTLSTWLFANVQISALVAPWARITNPWAERLWAYVVHPTG